MAKTKYVSKGQRPNVSKATRKAMRREKVGSLEQLLNKIEAWKQGKRVYITIPNRSPKETNKPFVRVLMKEEWGTYKRMILFSSNA